MNIIDIFCQHILFWIRSYCRISFIVFAAHKYNSTLEYRRDLVKRQITLCKNNIWNRNPPNFRLSIIPLSHQPTYVRSGIMRHYVVAFVCLHFCLIFYQKLIHFVINCTQHTHGNIDFHITHTHTHTHTYIYIYILYIYPFLSLSIFLAYLHFSELIYIYKQDLASYISQELNVIKHI